MVLLIMVVASYTDAWIESPASSMTTKHNFVASYTDAWIESTWWQLFIAIFWVASYTGAWIESMNTDEFRYKYSSHPTRMRGLKEL